MKLSLRSDQLRRYRDLIRLLVKHGRSDVVQAAGLDELMGPEEAKSRPSARETAAEGAELASDLEALGPTYIKLGQLLSTRADLLPRAYREPLSRLQDDVEPFDPDEAQAVVEEELGVRVSKAFQVFEREPLAVASLGQVHFGVLRSGQPVAVKVQRPGVRERIAEDLEALEGLAELLYDHTDVGQQYDLPGIVREFRGTLRDELDYRTEAGNLERLGENLARFRRLSVPQPISDYTTSRVLTLQFVEGRKLTDLGPLDMQELDGAPLADELFEAYLQQVLVDGFFHADPHPGNLLLTTDGTVSLLDLGMIGRVTPRTQERLLRLLVAVSEGEGEEAAEVAMTLGKRLPRFDRDGFVRSVAELVAAHQESRVEDVQVGRVVMSVTQMASENGMRLPSELTLLAKTLLNLDEVGRILDPGFDPNEAIRRHAGEIMRQRMFKMASPGNLLASSLELNEFVQRLPRRLNKMLDRLTTEDLEVKVDAFDEVHMMEGIQKLANRITMGLVLAALIVGAALLSQVETDFTILGYPGLAILFFLLAVLGGIILFVDILTHDEKIRRRDRVRGGGR